MTLHFEVSRRDLRLTRFVETDPAALQPGQIRVAIDKFAFTANNVTYAAFGDAMAYWAFFPAESGWGRIPVWGFADVVESQHEVVQIGERLYGYWPMSSDVVLQPERVEARTLMDGMPHRRPLPAAYQLYRRQAGEKTEAEDRRAILEPLLVTSFLIADFLDDNALFGAKQVVIASASSKTALGVAFLLKQRGDCEVVGLTSGRNRAFGDQVGYYTRTLTYGDEGTLPKVPTVFVDMAGDGKLLHAIHHHFGDALKHSCIVGATHWEDRQTQHQLPGPKPQFFFAPTRMQKRAKDWGPNGVFEHFGAAWRQFVPSIGAWLRVEHGRGRPAVEAVYRAVLDGQARPEQGHMLSLRA